MYDQHNLCKKEPKMRFSAIFSSLRPRIDPILHIMLVQNICQHLAMVRGKAFSFHATRISWSCMIFILKIQTQPMFQSSFTHCELARLNRLLYFMQHRSCGVVFFQFSPLQSFSLFISQVEGPKAVCLFVVFLGPKEPNLIENQPFRAKLTNF